MERLIIRQYNPLLPGIAFDAAMNCVAPDARTFSPSRAAAAATAAMSTGGLLRWSRQSTAMADELKPVLIRTIKGFNFSGRAELVVVRVIERYERPPTEGALGRRKATQSIYTALAAV